MAVVPPPDNLAKDQWFRWIVEGVSDYAFVFVDPEGHVVGWNVGAERITGYAADEIVGSHISRFYPAEAVAVDRPRQVLRKAREQGRVEDEAWRIRKDGSRFWASITMNALNDERGSLRGFGVVVHDLSERKRALDEIRELNQELTRRSDRLKAANGELEVFASAVAHDLRIPLRLINTLARLMQESYGARLDAGAAQLLRAIDRNSERLASMIGDLLEFCRVVGQPVRTEEVDMNALVADTWHELERWSGARLVVDDLPRASGDRSLLRHVWMNLLSNAVKFSAEADDPRIHVGGRIEDGAVVYWVEDNGIGFDMGHAERLFNIFQRLHSPGEYEGTGVGLAIVQRIVKRHRGEVRAKSEPGRGARFEFSIPIR